jgi:type VI secretion system secreted protein Hcp
MAETVHLKLKGQKQGDIKGESSQTSLDRADTIECFEFEYGASSPRDASTGMATGRRQWTPITIRKRFDRASPLLAQALVNNEVLTEGTFKFFRPDPSGDGTTQQFYTVQIKNGRVASFRQVVPHPSGDDGPTEHGLRADDHPYEEVAFVFQTITITNDAAKTSATDDWSTSNQ